MIAFRGENPVDLLGCRVEQMSERRQAGVHRAEMRERVWISTCTCSECLGHRVSATEPNRSHTRSPTQNPGSDK